ncbi:MAG: hypothetical protein AB7F09_13740 [Parvibaculaceae bacterium]
MHTGPHHPGKARFLILFWTGVFAAVMFLWSLAVWGGLAFWNTVNAYYAG